MLSYYFRVNASQTYGFDCIPPPPSSSPHARKTQTDFKMKRKKPKNSQRLKCIVWFQASLEHVRKIIVSGQQIQMAVAPIPVINTDSQESNCNQWERDVACQWELERNEPQMSDTSMGKVTHHFPTVSRPARRGESTSVLGLYQRVGGVQLFSISTGNGTKRFPIEWRECNFNIKRNDQL